MRLGQTDYVNINGTNKHTFSFPDKSRQTYLNGNSSYCFLPSGAPLFSNSTSTTPPPAPHHRSKRELIAWYIYCTQPTKHIAPSWLVIESSYTCLRLFYEISLKGQHSIVQSFIFKLAKSYQETK